jgi:predicted nucleic-acid-binding protein
MGGDVRAIDANVLVRMTARDEPTQLRLATAATAAGAWVSLLVLAETMWVLRDVYGQTRAQQIATLENLLSHESVVIQDSEVARVALDRFKQNSKVEFSDCLILEIARKAGHTPVATFDRDFSKLDGVDRITAKT